LGLSFNIIFTVAEKKVRGRYKVNQDNFTPKSNLYKFHTFFSLWFSENRAGPSNLGNVISQILLCKQIAPDFNQEEIFSISKDSEDLTNILTESQKHLPQQDSTNGKYGDMTNTLTECQKHLPQQDSTNGKPFQERAFSVYDNVRLGGNRTRDLEF
jgi:hypothetical protein